VGGVQQAFFDPQIALQALPKIWDGFLINLQVLGCRSSPCRPWRS
jgi:hypothetical protein